MARVTISLVMTRSLQTCAPCRRRVMMYAASPLVRFLNLSGNESPSEGSRKSCTDLLRYPHLFATNNCCEVVAGACRHFALRDKLESSLSKDARQERNDLRQ